MNNNYFSLAAPPRYVPWPVQAQVQFGGFLNFFGWLWFGFTMLFVWAFGSLTGFNDVYFWFISPDIAPGIITAIESTGASENDVPVYANHFTFRVERLEAEFQSVSYTTGQNFSISDTAEIEYLPGNPNIARIQNTRSGTFSPWVLCFVGIFPLVGLGMIGPGMYLGYKGNRLLKEGKMGLGRLVSKEPTNTRINKQTVYKLTFEFMADDGQTYQATARSHTPYNLEDEAQEQLVYDPRNPTRAVLLDSLPGEPDIDEFGNIQVADYGRSIRTLILPALVITVHGIIFLAVLVR